LERLARVGIERHDDTTVGHDQEPDAPPTELVLVPESEVRRRGGQYDERPMCEAPVPVRLLEGLSPPSELGLDSDDLAVGAEHHYVSATARVEELDADLRVAPPRISREVLDEAGDEVGFAGVRVVVAGLRLLRWHGPSDLLTRVPGAPTPPQRARASSAIGVVEVTRRAAADGAASAMWAGGNPPIAVSWSPVSDLWRQILLSVIDKGLLGLAAVFVGYRINLRLERFRAGRAFQAEFLRERTRRLDELYVAMLEVEVTATKYVGSELQRIDANRGKPGAFQQRKTPETIDAGAKFKIASETLARKAAHYRPWVGDRLHALGVEYGKVVRDNVTEQTIDGTHDIDEIGQLDERTKQLQAAIMTAIREGAPEVASVAIGAEQAPARPLPLAARSPGKRLSASKRS